MLTTTIDSGFPYIKDNFTRTYHSIRAYSTGDSVIRHRLRAFIAQDFYDSQSYAKIEKWSDEKGWLPISQHRIEELPCHLIKGKPSDDESLNKAFAESAEILFEIGEKFIGLS